MHSFIHTNDQRGEKAKIYNGIGLRDRVKLYNNGIIKEK